MPTFSGGDYAYKEDEPRRWDNAEVQAENKPGHKPLTAYQLPKWSLHPDLPTRRLYVMSEDYFGMAADGTRNMDNWNVAHVAAFHDDLKLLSLATLEQCKEPNKWGFTPAHMCGMGQHVKGPSLCVLYELLQLGAVDADALNYQDQTPLKVCQRMHKVANLKKFENVLAKGKKPDNYDQQREAQLRLRGKFARAVALDAAALENQPLPICLVFPGQGSQYVGMMQELITDISEVKDMLVTAKRILGYDILDIMLNGPADKLEQTKYCQPAMYIAGLAAIEKLKQDNADAVERCQAVAGLSLGEYVALTVAGVFDFETGLRLVKARAEAMEHETTKPGAKAQGMLSVAGLTEDVVNTLCGEVAVDGQVCQIANYLFPKGFSCAGDAAAIKDLEKKVTDAGALQAKLLKTSGAFHTPMMAPARDKLLKALEEAKPSMSPPRCKVYMNVTAKPIDAKTDVSEIIKLLGDQITSGVQWEKSMKNAIADGATEFYECGPSKQLKAMMKRIDANMVQHMSNILA